MPFDPCLCRAASIHSGFTSNVFCSACVQRALHSAQDKHRNALDEWRAVRAECSAALLEEEGDNDTSPAKLSELQEASRMLRERVEDLRERCSEAAIEVYAAQVQNEKRQERLLNQPQLDIPRETLQRMGKTLCHGESSAMTMAIEHSKRKVRALRFHWALAAFKMHRLDVELNEEDRSKLLAGRIKHARGIGKIGGLPLPHAGPELFGVLPPDELQSALRLVASLTSLLSRCLGIILPHPILLRQEARVAKDIADFDDEASLLFPENDDTMPSDPLGSSTSSLVAMAGRATRTALSSAIGSSTAQRQWSSARESHVSAPPSMDPDKVSKRIKHSAAAVLAEDQSKNSSLYVLSGQSINEDQFAIALQLLQNDVVALCIRAGVPVANLWPAEAVLLNLHALGSVLDEETHH